MAKKRIKDYQEISILDENTEFLVADSPSGGAERKIKAKNITTGIKNLTVAQGGTGATELELNSLLVGGGSGKVKTIDPGPQGNIIKSNGNEWLSLPDEQRGEASPTNLGNVYLDINTRPEVYSTQTVDNKLLDLDLRIVNTELELIQKQDNITTLPLSKGGTGKTSFASSSLLQVSESGQEIAEYKNPAWRPLEITNGWLNYQQGYALVGYLRNGVNIVEIKGVVTRPSPPIVDSVIAILPVGYRPLEIRRFTSTCSGGSWSYNIKPNGEITYVSGSDLTFTSIETRFTAEQ